MDMLIFPYNAMFAGAPSQKINTDFYVVSVNGKIAPITKQFYWKKDMLEQSANHYAVYKKNGENVYLHEYILNKHWPASVKENCINKLTPGHVTFHYWANWYLSIAGYHVQDGDSVALCSLKPIMIHDEIKFSEMKVIEQYKWKK